MTEASNRILILDANQRSALAAVRSLGKAPGVTIIAADATPVALAGTSKYCSEYQRYPTPYRDIEKFTQWLIRFVRENNIDFLLPMTEVTSRTALHVRAELGSCILPFANLNVVLALSDKWQLIQRALSLNIRCPESTLVENASAMPDLAPSQFPLIIKPCLSRIEHQNHWIETSVHIAHNSAELSALLREKVYLRDHAFILQEFILGHGAGIFALYQHGTPLAFFAHKRLREKPPSGGVSVLSESALPNPNLLQIAQQLLSSISWHGVAMVEFRIDENDEPYLMEVNTRFWGSLQLAIDAGVDFPRRLFDACSTGQSTPMNSNYKVGRRLRWLLGDLDNLYLTLRGNSGAGQKLRHAIQFFLPHPLSTKHEINRWNDLRPAWFELKAYVKNIVGKNS